MPGFSVSIDAAALAELLESADGPVGQQVVRAAIRVENGAKRLCPVDTGRLRSSISWELGWEGSELVAVVGTDVEYAPHVEFGTRHMRAQPFLRPALAAVLGAP